MNDDNKTKVGIHMKPELLRRVDAEYPPTITPTAAPLWVRPPSSISGIFTARTTPLT